MPRTMPQVEGVRHRFITILDRKIHVAEAGEPGASPSIVLVHDWPQSWYAWRQVLAGLGEDRHVVALDTRGQGWSEIAWTGMEQDALAESLELAVDELGLEKPWLVGHGWGAWTAGISASRNPGRWSGLTAIAGPLPWLRPRVIKSRWRHRHYRPIAWRWLGPYISHYHSPIDARKRGRMRRTHNRKLPRPQLPGYIYFVMRSLSTTPQAPDKALADEYAAGANAWTRTRASVNQFRDIFRGGLKRAADGEYPRPEGFPVNAIVGSKDKLWGESDYRVGTGSGSDVDGVAVANGAGHFVPEEDPQAVVDALLADLP